MPRPIETPPDLVLARELVKNVAIRARRCTDLVSDTHGADLYLFARAEEGGAVLVTIHGPTNFINRLVGRAIPGFDFDPDTFPLGPRLGLSTRTYRSRPSTKRKGARA